MLVATNVFEGLLRARATAMGLPGIRYVLIEHPLGGLDEDTVVERAHSVLEAIAAALRT